MRCVVNTHLSSDHFKDGTSAQIIYVHLRYPLCLTKISGVEGAAALRKYTDLLTQAYEMTAFQEKSPKGMLVERVQILHYEPHAAKRISTSL